MILAIYCLISSLLLDSLTYFFGNKHITENQQLSIQTADFPSKCLFG